MKYTRRKFVVSCFLLSAGSIVFSSPLALPLKFHDRNSDNDDIEELLLQAVTARNNGNYVLSEQLYNQIILLESQDLRAYFGLRKTYLMQKHKEYNVVRLFEQAYNNNPEDIRIICQLAKEYTSIALGNRQVYQLLNYEIPLLEKAYNLYELALSIDSSFPIEYGRGGEDDNNDEVFAEVGIKKVENKLEQQAGIIDARDNLLIKEERKQHRKQFKSRFDELSESEIEEKLNLIVNKPNQQKRSKHIKELYRLNIYRKKKLKKIEEACSLAFQLYLFDKKDPVSLGIYKKLAYETGIYSQLVTVLRDNDFLQNTFWSKLGYVDGLIALYKSTSDSETLNLLSSASNQLTSSFNLTPQMKKELIFRKFELSMINQNLPESKENLIDAVDFLFGTNSPHDAIRLCKLLAKYFETVGQKTLAIRFIDLLLSSENPTIEQSTLQDELNFGIVQFFSQIRIEKTIHFDQLYKLREKLN